MTKKGKKRKENEKRNKEKTEDLPTLKKGKVNIIKQRKGEKKKSNKGKEIWWTWKIGAYGLLIYFLEWVVINESIVSYTNS